MKNPPLQRKKIFPFKNKKLSLNFINSNKYVWTFEIKTEQLVEYFPG